MKLRKMYKCGYENKGSLGQRFDRIDKTDIMFSLIYDYDTLDKGNLMIRNKNGTKYTKIRIEELEKHLEIRGIKND